MQVAWTPVDYIKSVKILVLEPTAKMKWFSP
jgi:hypothetical protein